MGKIVEELSTVKKHFDIVLEKISEGILEITSDGRIVYANPKALSFFQISEELLLGSNFAELFAGDDRLRVLNLLKTFSEKLKIIPGDSSFKLTFESKASIPERSFVKTFISSRVIG